jgi:hypothetical protein
VHGEEDQSMALKDSLKEMGYKVILPSEGETLKIGEE